MKSNGSGGFTALVQLLKDKYHQSEIYHRRCARNLAMTSKRIDICSAQFVHSLHLAKHESIEGKVCLEIGAGRVLTHALVCYLLGAKKVIATDVMPLARPEVLPIAINNAISSIPRDVLAPFSNHAEIRDRYNRLLSVRQYSFQTLEDFGIHYRSPLDLAIEGINEPVDFIYSNSVLEHVPKSDIRALLNNLVGCLNVGGSMIHCVHMEDHIDIEGAPFGFLDIPESDFSRDLETNRGNRLRYSQWVKIFSELENMEHKIFYKYSRLDKPVPPNVDSSISYDDISDLRTSHIGIYARKLGN